MNATHQQVLLVNVVQMLFAAIHPEDSLARANLGLQETHLLIVTVSFTISQDVTNLGTRAMYSDYITEYFYDLYI